MSDSGSSQPNELHLPTDETVEDPLSDSELDDHFEQLSNRQRRSLLLLLKRGEIETTADVLERATCPERLEIELVHAHLPELATAGYVEWDRECGSVAKGPRFDSIEPLLELLESSADELLEGSGLL